MAKGKKVADKKRKRSTLDFDPENLHPVDPSSFIAASQEAAKVEQANCLRKKREVAIPMDPTDQEGGYTPDLALEAAIK